MWPFQKRTARQKEIRRSRLEQTPGLLNRVFERIPPALIATTFGLGLVAALIVNMGGYVFDLREGQRVTRPISARVNFSIGDTQRTLALKMQARDTAPNWYILDTALVDELRGRLNNALRIAKEHGDDLAALRKTASAISVDLDEAAAAELANLAAQSESSAYVTAVDVAAQNLVRLPIIERVEANELSFRRTAPSARLSRPDGSDSVEVPVALLLFPNDPDTREKIATAVAAPFPEALKAAMGRSVLAMLRGSAEGTLRPLYRFDSARSDEAARRAELTVKPQFTNYVVGGRLTDVGDISAEELRILAREHDAFAQEQLSDPSARLARLLEHLARGALAFLVVVGLGGYIVLYRDGLRLPLPRALATAGMLVLTLATARLTYVATGNPYLAAGAHAFAVVMLAIVHPRGSAFAAGALLGLLITLATQATPAYFILLLSVTMTLLIGLRDIRNRGKIVAVGAIACVVAFATTLLTGLADGQTLSFVIRNQAAWAALSTLAAAFIVEGILPGVERLWGLSTSMTLLEWCDANKPLLRMLASEAPGTYNHSLLVGVMAEAAAEAIGGNGLLARAGAYYHDIGKVRKPEYFIENQDSARGSRHERLSPAMSLLIIIGHIKDGVEMAKEYGLPASLHPFIAQHHGTTLVEFFYHAAKGARKPDDPEISESDYRYPGPKPQSREVAVLMVCDAVEGAVRAMPEPTPRRIEDTVTKIIQKRLLDGQFDESDLTFRDLAAIRESVVKSLNSIYHARITYPSDEQEARDSGIRQAETRSAS